MIEEADEEEVEPRSVESQGNRDVNTNQDHQPSSSSSRRRRRRSSSSSKIEAQSSLTAKSHDEDKGKERERETSVVGKQPPGYSDHMRNRAHCYGLPLPHLSGRR